MKLYTRHFNKVGYSTESRSTGVCRLALRNQTNCFQIQIFRFYFVTIPMVTGRDEGTILVIESSPPLYHHHYLWLSSSSTYHHQHFV